MAEYIAVYCYDGDIELVNKEKYSEFRIASLEMFNDIWKQVEEDENFSEKYKKEIYDFLQCGKGEYNRSCDGMSVSISEKEAHIVSDAYHCHWKVLGI
jgi:hypothetical protein